MSLLLLDQVVYMFVTLFVCEALKKKRLNTIRLSTDRPSDRPTVSGQNDVR